MFSQTDQSSRQSRPGSERVTGAKEAEREARAGPRYSVGQWEGCREGVSEVPRKPGPGRDEAQETQGRSTSRTQDSPG